MCISSFNISRLQGLDSPSVILKSQVHTKRYFGVSIEAPKNEPTSRHIPLQGTQILQFTTVPLQMCSTKVDTAFSPFMNRCGTGLSQTLRFPRFSVRFLWTEIWDTPITDTCWAVILRYCRTATATLSSTSGEIVVTQTGLPFGTSTSRSFPCPHGSPQPIHLSSNGLVRWMEFLLSLPHHLMKFRRWPAKQKMKLDHHSLVVVGKTLPGDQHILLCLQ